MSSGPPSNQDGEERLDELLQSCAFVDLEADAGRIFQIGAVRQETTFERKGDFDVRDALRQLDQFVAGSRFIVGHNLLRHDWPILHGFAPGLSLLTIPVVDTLFLSPLAFPENPYHALIKDYKLVRSAVNNPVGDARLSAQVLRDEWDSLRAMAARGDAERLSFYRFCFVHGLGTEIPPVQARGLVQFLELVGATQVDVHAATSIFGRLACAKACQSAMNEVLSRTRSGEEWAGLAYCAAWLGVAGSNSVLPPWVRHQFPAVVGILKQLRDTPCGDSNCAYCREVHDPVGQLRRYFSFEQFRPKPASQNGASLQEAIVRAGLGDRPLLAILPTSGGKSLCYQLPALVRNFRRGALTVIVSPLQALMKDQVDNLSAKTGTPSAAALYGLLTPPERGEVLERTRLGDIAILYVSPEQLRNRSFIEAIAQRELGCWVFDEAHCLSKWGHDFRPDYLYASRFIREFAEKHHVPVPPVACFTATAKLDVLQEIVLHFREALDQKLEVFHGDIERDNLRFEVQPVTRPEKFPRVQELLAERLQAAGSAVIYTATRKGAEDAAQYLAGQGWPARAYHAGLTAAQKREIQDAFVRGTVRVICATNAFGMGIDKDDVRVVIHVDLPGSLENYLQEAGRAGRDARSAECVLLFTEEDVETQFQLASRSQLTQRDISQILRGLRRARHKDNVVIITSGELLGDEQVETTFEADDQMADTKVKTAVAWLERSGFLERNENRTNVFQGRPLVGDMKEAETWVTKLGLPERKQRQWLAVLGALFKCDRPEGLNADDLAQLPALREDVPGAEGRERPDETDSQRVVRMLHEMAEAGLVKQGLLLSAFIRFKVKDSSTQRLERASAVETALFRTAQELAPDAENHNWQYLSLRRMNQALVDQGLESSPELLRALLVSLSRDGKGFAQSHATLEFRHCYGDHYRVQLRRDWATALELSQKRRAVARVILDAILAKIPTEAPAGADLLVEFSTDEIAEAIRKDLILAGQIKDTLAAIDRGLMYLHEQKAIILQHGLAVFRQAMTIHMLPRAKGRRYTKAEFDPLARHYEERIFQVHVMSEYARRGLESIPRGLELVASYFRDPRAEFVSRYFGGRQDIITRAITQEAYQAIVENLRNPVQIAVVAAPEDRNMLILAGPGSGKTRAVVHRVAYLVKVKRARARSILVLCFNRRAAIELRVRLRELIGTEAAYVDVMTYHGLAMRLSGTSFAERCSRPGEEPLDFDALIVDATRILRGETNLPGVEADELRDRLLAGYRFILVDEYQDIDAPQYELISALADRTGKDPEGKLSILAVGDDDQNIYAFRGTSVEFIQRFEKDYAAEKHYLVENYRSTANIIAASNALIARNRVRMKADRSIQINRTREKDPLGGTWERPDPLGRGKVQILSVAKDQSEALAIVTEMRRLRDLRPSADWSSFAVLARTKHLFPAIRALCEHHGIPVCWNLENDRIPKLHRIREFATFLDMIAERREQQFTATELLARCKSTATRTDGNPWTEELVRLLETWREETADSPMPGNCLTDFLYEALAEQRREQRLGRGVFLSTIHAAKGTEFDQVLIPASGWTMPSARQDVEEERRLLYVGMTRARCTLALVDGAVQHNPYLAELNGQHILRRAAAHQELVPPGLLERSYTLLGMTDMYLDLAARCEPEHRIHAAIARVQPSTRLQHRLRGQMVELVDANGHCVGQLSQTAALTWRSQLGSVEEIRVMAVIRRLRADSKPEYRDACRCDRWEVPLVEVVHHVCAGPAR